MTRAQMTELNTLKKNWWWNEKQKVMTHKMKKGSELTAACV